MSTADVLTQGVNKATEVLFTRDPDRTALGVALGLSLYSVALVLDPVPFDIPFVSLTHLPWWGWMCLGILAAHIPKIFGSGVPKSFGDKELDNILKVIKIANFPPAEQCRQYRSLVQSMTEKYIDRLEAESLSKARKRKRKRSDAFAD